VARAMEWVVEITQGSDLEFDDLCETAKKRLELHVPQIASLVGGAPLVSSTAARAQVAVARERFVRQIDEGVRAVRLGYIEERSISMTAAETVQAKAHRMLRVIDDYTRNRVGGIELEQVAKLSGLSAGDARASWTYLTHKRLIELFSIKTIGRTNAHGVDAIEAGSTTSR